jgi:hypothetical protein
VPHTADIERIAEACEAWQARQGFGAEDEVDAADADDAQAVIQHASLLGQAALGERAGKHARRVQVLGGKELALPGARVPGGRLRVPPAAAARSGSAALR